MSTQRADLRKRLGVILDELDDQKLREVIEESLNAEKLKYAYCPDCKKKIPVDYPDLDKRAKVLSLLLDQAKGRPQESKTVQINVSTRVQEMTDAEIDAELGVIESAGRELLPGD